ncbi:MAG: DISARM system phospholipase D-like protein DrmC [Planctomycetaceae bacterium]
MLKKIAKELSDIVSDMPAAIVDGLVSDLLSVGHHAVGRAASSAVRHRLASVLVEAQSAGLGRDAVALAVQTALHAYQSSRKSQSVELVWTGPSPPQSHLRRTDQALLEVVAKAESELWVVSFAAYGVQIVMDALRDAVLRNVTVSLVLESSEQSDGRLSGDQIDVLRTELGERARVYIWPKENRKVSNGRRGTLHAKCAVADSQHLFVSSANLTNSALELNMELGVLVGGEKNASLVQRQLNWLVESNTLRRL